MTMTLSDLLRRSSRPVPWEEGDNIPWNDPGVSRRMLKEHLSQEHDAASRRTEKIRRHVDWIHHAVLGGNPARILDLACGPGLYSSRLAELGHECVGIDYSPASIEYAKTRALEAGLRSTYTLGDIRREEYGRGFRLAMLIYGEFNVFRPQDARLILGKVIDALEPGGVLLMEPHTMAAVRKLGREPSTWYAAERGIFSDDPHLCLSESFWDGGTGTATRRYFIVDASTALVTRYAQTFQAYSRAQYRTVMICAGFRDPQFFPSLMGSVDRSEPDLLALLARK